MVAPRLALGAPYSPEVVFDTIDTAVLGQGTFPSKEIDLGCKLLASANLGTGAVVRRTSGSSIG
eukprot:9622644-Ditylum_brightwellii.AAC.1